MKPSGVPPKPTALKILQGNPGRRPLNENEPKPEVADVAQEPPIGLSEKALHIWKTMCPILARIGLLTVCDLRLLARYCDLFTRWVECRDFLDANGTSYEKLNYYNIQVEDVDGKMKWVRQSEVKSVAQYPQAQMYLQLSRELCRLESELGLTPSARSRIHVEVFNKGDKPGDRFADFLASNTRKPLVGG